ncbi:MAG: substrate-binding domain-containing protein, partial [Hyphomonadaceae bacterium]|nr:substrate-binding domain-containing protein [Clostridia bacterium]
MEYYKNIIQWISKQPKQRLYLYGGLLVAIILTITAVSLNMRKEAPQPVLEVQAPVAVETETPAPTATPTIAPENATPVPDKALQAVNDIKIEAPPSAATMKGTIIVDGSAIAGQISQLVADKFHEVYKKIQVDVGVSGTKEGLERFAKGEIDICESTRQMTADEANAVAGAGIGYQEFKLGYNGIVIVTSPSASFGDEISLTEIRKLWDARTRARRFNEVNAKWPATPIKLFCKESDAVNFNSVVFDGTDNEYSRGNTRFKTDQEILSKIQNEPDAIAFMNYELYAENKGNLKALKLITAEGPVAPTNETLKSGK